MTENKAFLSKLSNYLGRGKYIRFDRIKFSENLAQQEKLICKEIFLYTSPPFQSNQPSDEEEKRKRGYDRFINNLRERKVVVREGRCQRLKINEKFEYHQKGVDVLITMDLTNIPLQYPEVKRIILISSDSDFVPVIKNLEKNGVKTIVYTYYEKNRNSQFSRSNDLIKSVYKYRIISINDLLKTKLQEKEKND
ncbi:MAG TPA: NYN domain-containing protein [Candidatus Nanoarchaeia archaeon]|nr:NYN domain-containing protein [Candidatus Nanoarchaeia archaeon]